MLYELLLSSLYLIQKISFLVLLRQFSRQNAKGNERECACGGRAKVPLPPLPQPPGSFARDDGSFIMINGTI